MSETGLSPDEDFSLRESFDLLVDFLFASISAPSPHPAYTSILDFAAQAIDARACRFGVLLPVPCLTFTFTLGGGEPLIMWPFQWGDYITKGPIHLDTLRVCSNLVDFFHDKYIGQEEAATVRSEAIQAEWCRRVRLHRNSSEYEQRKALLVNRYPDGLSTPSVQDFIYIPREFDEVRLKAV